MNKSSLLLSILALATLFGCYTLHEIRTDTRIPVAKDALVLTYETSKLFYAPFGAPLRDNLKSYRDKAYEYAAKRYNLAREEILLVNEKLEYTNPVWWESIYAVATFFMASWAEQKYTVDIVRK